MPLAIKASAGMSPHARRRPPLVNIPFKLVIMHHISSKASQNFVMNLVRSFALTEFFSTVLINLFQTNKISVKLRLIASVN